MVCCTNNFKWSASAAAGLHKAKWAGVFLVKELKQTLQFQ